MWHSWCSMRKWHLHLQVSAMLWGGWRSLTQTKKKMRKRNRNEMKFKRIASCQKPASQQYFVSFLITTFLSLSLWHFYVSIATVFHPGKRRIRLSHSISIAEFMELEFTQPGHCAIIECMLWQKFIATTLHMHDIHYNSFSLFVHFDVFFPSESRKCAFYGNIFHSNERFQLIMWFVFICLRSFRMDSIPRNIVEWHFVHTMLHFSNYLFDEWHNLLSYEWRFIS